MDPTMKAVVKEMCHAETEKIIEKIEFDRLSEDAAGVTPEFLKANLFKALVLQSKRSIARHHIPLSHVRDHLQMMLPSFGEAFLEEVRQDYAT